MGGVMAGYATGWDTAGGLYGAAHVFCRYRCSVSCSNHAEEDKTVLRQAGSVRYGTSTVSCSIRLRTVLLHVWERLKGFIIKAGTILFLACVVMWFLGGPSDLRTVDSDL